MQKVFSIFTEMEKVSNWCDVLSRILHRPTYWRRECYVDESCLALWEGFREEFRNPPEYEIREYRECVWYYSNIWYRNSLKKFWMWNAWEIHHRHERDQCWQMMRRSSGRRQEYLSTLILFTVLLRRKKVQEQQKSGKANLKTLRCIHHIKMQWESMEKQLNSSGKNSKIFQDCPFFKRSRKTWYRRTSNRRNQIICRVHVQRHLWKSDDRNWISNAEKVNDYAKQFLPGHWTFLGPGSEMTWYGGSHEQQFKKTRHPIFTDISA